MRRTHLLAALFIASAAFAAAAEPHNVILYVPDGLRGGMVTPEQAPNMAELAKQGVRFCNSHSLFPTFTTPNASAFATGHYLGDSGDFSNTLYAGFKVPAAHDSVTPFIENDQVLAELDKHFAGNFLNEETILEQAAAKGYNTAAIGKLGPTLIFAHKTRDAGPTIIIDDRSGRSDGVTLPSWLTTTMTEHDITVATPSRGDNGLPNTTSADVQQLSYFSKVIAELILPKFKEDKKPFFLVYWSRDPDGTQHNQGDSENSLTPGINGPTSLAGIKNADDHLGRLRATLKQLGLDQSTDIIVAADHGFSTISKQSKTSPAAQGHYDDVPAGLLPPGFLALDLAKALSLPLADPDQENAAIGDNQHSKSGNGLLGPDPTHPLLVVAANGGSDLIYLPGDNPQQTADLARRTVAALLQQDYVSGLFVDAKFGAIPGTLPTSALNLDGAAVTPKPAIVVNFRTGSTGCAIPSNCQIEVADSTLGQGQGMHGSLGRGDSYNFIAAIGPDFKQGYEDKLPVSNADVGQTIARLLGLTSLPNKGKLLGRVMTEALPGGTEPKATSKTLRSAPAMIGASQLTTELKLQQVGDQLYFDAAGFAGRTNGLDRPGPP
jgi:arylsulfatase A-like enzyme